MAKRGSNTEVTSSGVTSLSEVAEKFFEANPFYESILITEDGVVFDNTLSGKNAADNYVSGLKISYSQFNKS